MSVSAIKLDLLLKVWQIVFFDTNYFGDICFRVETFVFFRAVDICPEFGR